jgi:hypothetical protein
VGLPPEGSPNCVSAADWLVYVIAPLRLPKFV